MKILLPFYLNFIMSVLFREKKKRGERETQKANETVTKCLGDYQYAGR